MIGTLRSRNSEIGKPTTVSFVGYLSDTNNNCVNLKKEGFHPSVPQKTAKNLFVIVGTGMNFGKTTSSKLIQGLAERDMRVSACKLTGSVSNRDQDEMRSALATQIIDFSDYGFPSTYLCPKEELLTLFNTMLSDIEKVAPDVAVMEIADGILQRETRILLSEPILKKNVKGILLTATDSTSALYGVQQLKDMGYNIIAVSGAITSSPLFVREFQEFPQSRSFTIQSGKVEFRNVSFIPNESGVTGDPLKSKSDD
jgi:predicted GTPase